MIVLQYYIPMKEVNHVLNNITLIHPNSSTKATWLWKEGNLGVRMWSNQVEIEELQENKSEAVPYLRGSV